MKAFQTGKWLLWAKPDSTWSWLLKPLTNDQTRLIVRIRARPVNLFWTLFMEFGDPPMATRMLKGIKVRAERMNVRGLAARMSGGHAVGRAVIANEVDIKQPPEAVFDYVSDHTHEREWNTQMRSVRKLTEGPVGAGTRYEMEFVPGKPMVATCEQFDRPRSWEVVGQALGMDVTLGGRVSQIPSGSHLVFRTEFRSQGVKSLVLPLIRRRMASQMQHHVERIKSILEAQAGFDPALE